MIDFNQIYKMATDVIGYITSSGGYIEPNTTVCVILAKSGRTYNGVSHNEVHAEIEAVRNMQGFNENAVDALILVDANTRLALLPCANCIRYIISLNPMNSGALVNMPDRPVPFQEILSQNTPSQQLPFSSVPMPHAAVSAGRSSVVVTGRAKGALLNGKVNSLLAAAKEEEQSEEDLELMRELTESAQKKKGLFGGLFGKK